MNSKINYQIAENEEHRICKSENYNFIFNKKTGFFARWGKTKEEDPDYSPFGPELADIEVTTKCSGVTGKDGVARVCKFCYKSNTPDGVNMSFEDFKTIFDKLCKVKIIIELDNNEIIKVNPETSILLKNGNIIKAENLSSDDEIDRII